MDIGIAALSFEVAVVADGLLLVAVKVVVAVDVVVGGVAKKG